jgi:acyl carrier protein
MKADMCSVDRRRRTRTSELRVLSTRFVSAYGAYRLIATTNTIATIRTLRKSATISAPDFAEAGPQRRFRTASRLFQREGQLAALCFLKSAELSIIKKLHKTRARTPYDAPHRLGSIKIDLNQCGGVALPVPYQTPLTTDNKGENTFMASAADDIVEMITARTNHTPDLSESLDDLGLDSMEVVSLIFDIEEKFNIQIPINANLDIESKTLADLIQAVDLLVADKVKSN